MKVRGVEHGAHVWAFLEAGGELTDEKPFVLHSCDNRPCVNPAHLRAGSNQDNMDDKVERRRQATGAAVTMPRRNRKLNPEAVRAIRAAKGRGESTTALATEFGVSVAAVNMVARRTRWAWVAD